MAKVTNKTAKKAVFGGTNKSIKLTKRTSLFALLSILAFSTVAGLGWQSWDNHQLNAKAAGYKILYSGYGGQIVFKACTPDYINYKFLIVNSSLSIIILNPGIENIRINPHTSYGPYYQFNFEQLSKGGVLIYQYTGYGVSSLPRC